MIDMKLVQSPLFEAVLWEGRGFKILDETLIPDRIEYIRIDEVAQAIDAVRAMKTRAFGQVLTFLYSGVLLAQEYHCDDPVSLRDRRGQRLISTVSANFFPSGWPICRPGPVPGRG